MLNLSTWFQHHSFLILSYTINYGGKTSHYLSGPSQDLLVYLKKRAKRVIFFEQPDPVSEDLTPWAKVYEKGQLVQEYSFPMFWFPLKKGRREIVGAPWLYFLFKMRDFLSTCYFFIRLRQRFELVVAVESLNALLSCCLRGLKIIRFVIYDNIDYSPQRFEKRWLNNIFHTLDRWAVACSNGVWNQTSLVAAERFRRGRNHHKTAPQWVKPTGVLEEKIGSKNITDIHRSQVVYVGSFLRRDGVEVLIEAFYCVAREIPQAKLVLIGEGELLSTLKEKVHQMGIASQCDFLGVIEEEAQLENILSESAIGVAPYSDEEGSVKHFNDVSKPKVYLSCGLPVVITRVPSVALEIDSRGAGIAVNYNAQDIAKALLKLLTDDVFFQRCRERAIEMARDYTWDRIYDRLFLQFLEITYKGIGNDGNG